MYLEFFQLNEEPLSYLTPKPRFFYYAPQYLSVKHKVDYVVSERNGHLYIHGSIGSGKTTLLKTVSQMLDDEARNMVNFLNAPNLKTANSLLRRICDGFGVKTERSYNATLENFTKWLVTEHQAERFPVLIIDEAQNIVRDGLKTLHYFMTYVTSLTPFHEKHRRYIRLDDPPTPTSIYGVSKLFGENLGWLYH